MKASEYCKLKPVNVVNEKWNDDGTVDVTIYKQRSKKAYKFRARNLNQKNEEILEDEEVDETEP